jgi:enoyl-CoA hydratase/carnithine racemase
MQDISYEETGHVGVITLMRPEVHNALRLETYAELTELVHNATARVLVITGAGRSFCSGDDVRAVSGGAGPVFDEEITPAAGALLATDIPVIAAVNGTAVGWGWSLRCWPTSASRHGVRVSASCSSNGGCAVT